MTEIIAVELKDLGAGDILLSDKQYKNWDFVDGSGKTVKGEKTYWYDYYKQQKVKLCIVLKGLKSSKGIQTSMRNNKMSAFMSVNPDDGTKALIQNTIHKYQKQAIFANKDKLLPPHIAKNIKRVEDLEFIFDGIISPGKEIKGKPGETWKDSIMMTVPMSTKNNQQGVDTNLCIIEDPEGRPYNWTELDNKPLVEVILEVEMTHLKDGRIVSTLLLRSVVPDGVPHPKVTSRRKLDQLTSGAVDAPANAGISQAPAVAAPPAGPAPTPVVTDADTPEQAAKRQKQK